MICLPGKRLMNAKCYHQMLDQSRAGIRRERTRVRRSWKGALSAPSRPPHRSFFSQEIASMREIFKSQFLKVEVFLPFFVGWSGSSSLTAWNRKASTLWRGGALWGKLRTRCHQARGLGPGRGHHHHREAFLTRKTFPNKSWRAR